MHPDFDQAAAQIAGFAANVFQQGSVSYLQCKSI